MSVVGLALRREGSQERKRLSIASRRELITNGGLNRRNPDFSHFRPEILKLWPVFSAKGTSVT